MKAALPITYCTKAYSLNAQFCFYSISWCSLCYLAIVYRSSIVTANLHVVLYPNHIISLVVHDISGNSKLICIEMLMLFLSL